MSSMKNNVIAWDVETHLIKPGMVTPKFVCMTENDGESSSILVGENALERTKFLISNRDTTFHTFFDFGVVAAEKPETLPEIFRAIDEGRAKCTRIRDMMIHNATGKLKFIWNEEDEKWERVKYRLQDVVYRRFGYDVAFKKKGPDVWRLRFNELDGIPLSQWPPGPEEYAIEDAVLTKKAHDDQEKDLGGDELPGQIHTMQSAWMLYLMGVRGFRTDIDTVRKYESEMRVEFDKHVAVCQEYGFRRKGSGTLNTKKVRAAVEKWFREHDITMKMTPKGAISINREQLNTTDHPGLHAVAKSKYFEKNLTTYIKALYRGAEVPLIPNYNAMLESFRTSCSMGTKIDGVAIGMNVQNLPRAGNIRDCVVPRHGWVFVFCDYDTLEMLTLAQACYTVFGYSALRDAANQGLDFHVALAADTLGISYRNAWRRYEEGDALIENARQYSKIGNYGLGGGMGPGAFVNYAKGYGIKVEMDSAKLIHKLYRRRWPETVDFFNYASAYCGSDLREHEEAWRDEGNSGMYAHPLTGMVRGNMRYTAFCNHMFQHPAAIGAKSAGYQVTKECYIDTGSPLYGCRPWLFLHDEIGLEVPVKWIGQERAHAAAMRLQEIMVEEMNKVCPDVPIKATVAMAKRWYKGAKPVYHKGCLVPSIKRGKKWVHDA